MAGKRPDDLFELTTALTDGLLATGCLLGGMDLLLLRHGGLRAALRRSSRSVRSVRAEPLMGCFLATLSCALLAGGAYHGMPPAHPHRPHVWTLTSVLVSAGFALLLAATGADVRGSVPLWAVAAACAAAAGAPSAASLATNSFAPLLWWELACIATHACAHFVRLLRPPAGLCGVRRRAALALAGDAFVLLSGAVQQSAAVWGPFDHNGLYHIVQLPSIALLWAAYAWPVLTAEEAARRKQAAFMHDDRCIRVDEGDNVVGHASKLECHRGHGLLHRAFSVLLFDTHGRLLLQRRSAHKVTFPRMWANTCCSHPLFGAAELAEQPPGFGAMRAAQRKLLHELGIRPEQIPLEGFVFLTRLLYVAPSDADWHWSENEIDYILVFVGDVDVAPNPEEVAETRYVTREELAAMMADPKQAATIAPWMLEISKRFIFSWWDALLQAPLDDPAAIRRRLAPHQDHATVHRVFK